MHRHIQKIHGPLSVGHAHHRNRRGGSSWASQRQAKPPLYTFCLSQCTSPMRTSHIVLPRHPVSRERWITFPVSRMVCHLVFGRPAVIFRGMRYFCGSTHRSPSHAATVLSYSSRPSRTRLTGAIGLTITHPPRKCSNGMSR